MADETRGRKYKPREWHCTAREGGGSEAGGCGWRVVVEGGVGGGCGGWRWMASPAVDLARASPIEELIEQRPESCPLLRVGDTDRHFLGELASHARHLVVPVPDLEYEC